MMYEEMRIYSVHKNAFSRLVFRLTDENHRRLTYGNDLSFYDLVNTFKSASGGRGAVDDEMTLLTRLLLPMLPSAALRSSSSRALEHASSAFTMAASTRNS
jgi:hypothetical protein